MHNKGPSSNDRDQSEDHSFQSEQRESAAQRRQVEDGGRVPGTWGLHSGTAGAAQSDDW